MVALLTSVIVATACGSAGAKSGSRSTTFRTASGGVRTQETMVSSGEQRSFIFYRGATAPAAGAPLVIVIHGAGSSGAGIETLTHFDPLADAHGFDVAYPNAVNYPGTSQPSWRIGCCSAWGDSSTDVTFFSNLIDRLARTNHINKRRVYVVGFSVGAAMAYRLACELSSKVAAIGSVGGFEYLTIPCAPKRPVSVYEIHGTKDYYGGSCGGSTQSNAACPNNFGDPGYEPSVLQVNAQWRRIDRCPAHGSQQVEGTVTVQMWQPCAAKSGVALATIQNGAHCWPSTDAVGCTRFDAAGQFWNFFSRRRLAPAPAVRHSHVCIVPTLRGLSAQMARQALQQADCRLGRVRRPKSVPAGDTLTVMRQSLRAGTHRPRGTRVNVTLGYPSPAKYH